MSVESLLLGLCNEGREDFACDGSKEGGDVRLVDVVESLKLVEVDLIGPLAAEKRVNGRVATRSRRKEGA